MPNSWQMLTGTVALLASALSASAQQTPPQAVQSLYLASTSAQMLQLTGVSVSGDVHVANGSMQLGNGSTITAGNETLPITLTRGGRLRLCATTTLHLAHDRSIEAADDTGLMLGLDRGAIEARYTTSKYSDVLLTPDLRILISGPGEADLAIRVNNQGDTCIDNRGPNAPYITVTSPLEGGLYRVQPGQHVSFEHGSLREVVDSETESCGCPAPVAVTTASSAHPAGGPSSTPADTAFPLAVSEGLASPPQPPITPVAAPGEVHAQVSVPFRYDGSLPTVSQPTTDDEADPKTTAAGVSEPVPPPSSTAPAPTVSNMTAPPRPQIPAGSIPATAVAPLQETIAPVPAKRVPTSSPGFFRRIGRFFARVFGAED